MLGLGLGFGVRVRDTDTLRINFYSCLKTAMQKHIRVRTCHKCRVECPTCDLYTLQKMCPGCDVLTHSSSFSSLLALASSLLSLVRALLSSTCGSCRQRGRKQSSEEQVHDLIWHEDGVSCVQKEEDSETSKGRPHKNLFFLDQAARRKLHE